MDGVRNSVGHAWNPANGELWFTDNQVDGMGDDIPPGELNRVTATGTELRLPVVWRRRRAYRAVPGRGPAGGCRLPRSCHGAHAADLGMTFYNGKMFPEKYRGGIFSAQHGSWNRTTPVGARVMFTSLNEDGSANETVPFAEGWLVEENG